MKISQVPYKITTADNNDLIFIERPSGGTGSIKFEDLKTSLGQQQSASLQVVNSLPSSPEPNNVVFLANNWYQGLAYYHPDFNWVSTLQQKTIDLSNIDGNSKNLFISNNGATMISFIDIAGYLPQSVSQGDIEIRLIRSSDGIFHPIDISEHTEYFIFKEGSGIYNPLFSIGLGDVLLVELFVRDTIQVPEFSLQITISYLNSLNHSLVN